VLVHGHQDEIGGLTADLPAKAATGELDEDRSAPFFGRAAGGDTLAVLRPDDEGALLIAGYDDDAGGPSQNALRDAFVGRGHHFLDHGLRAGEALIELRVVLSDGCERGGAEEGQAT